MSIKFKRFHTRVVVLEVVASSPAAFSKLLITDVLKWGKAVKDSGAVTK